MEGRGLVRDAEFGEGGHVANVVDVETAEAVDHGHQRHQVRSRTLYLLLELRHDALHVQPILMIHSVHIDRRGGVSHILDLQCTE